jgi:hypothetical protein
MTITPLPETITWYSTEKRGSSYITVKCMYPSLQRAPPLPLVETHINDRRMKKCYEIFKQTEGTFSTEEAAINAAKDTARLSGKHHVPSHLETNLIVPLDGSRFELLCHERGIPYRAIYDQTIISPSNVARDIRTRLPSNFTLFSPSLPYEPIVSFRQASNSVSWLSIAENNGAYHVFQTFFPSSVLFDGEITSRKNYLPVSVRPLISTTTKAEAISQANALSRQSHPEFPVISEEESLFCIIDTEAGLKVFSLSKHKSEEVFYIEGSTPEELLEEIRKNNPYARVLTSPTIPNLPESTSAFRPIKKARQDLTSVNP